MTHAMQALTLPILNQPIVVSARFRENADAMEQLLTSQGASCTIALAVEEIINAIQADAALVIITEEALAAAPTIDWLSNCLNQQPKWSDIPVIFLLKDCRQFTTCLRLLRETHCQRSILMLETPLKHHEFLSVIKSCLQNRQRQYALRDILQELHQSNRTLESFGHTVAHELRNPLGVMMTSLDLLARSPLEDRQQHLVEMGLRNSRRMDQTMRALLEFGKLGDRRRLMFDSVDMTDVVEQALQGLQALIDTHQVHIERMELPTVTGNRDLLVRLISNLIKNAIVHNDNDMPFVLVSVEKQANRYQFQITDNGPGIAEEHQHQIFNMFAQIQSVQKQGSGIGLALCRRIVQQHQGDLRVQSEVGQGSTFYFDLPTS